MERKGGERGMGKVGACICCQSWPWIIQVQAHRSWHWPCRGLFFLSLVAISFMLDCKSITHSKNPNWTCLALTTCKPPDWISFLFALFSPQIPKLVSKISWTKSALKKQLMSGAHRTTFLWVLAKPNSVALKKQKTLKQSKCLTVY